LAIAGCLMTRAPEASAVERQHHVGIAPGLGVLATDQSPTSLGGLLGGFYTYGLNDQFNLMVEGAAGLHTYSKDPLSAEDPTVPATRPSVVGSAAAGVSYVLDVLRYVPYGGLLVGADFLSGGTMDRLIAAPTLQIALGLDYQFNRTFNVGFAYRQHLMLTRLATYPSYSTLFLKAEIAWGY
jgi:hypothetical protein